MKTVVYLINLDGSDNRLASAQTQLKQAKVAFERVSAFDGRGKELSDFDFVDQSRMWTYLGRRLSGGEVGCYLSHVDCVKRFLSSDADICIVLEDDLHIPHPSFMNTLLETVRFLPDRWQIINFGNQKNKIYTPLKKFRVDSFESTLVKAHYFPMTTTGICWSREGAEAFLHDAFPIFVSVDRFLRHWQTRKGRGYCFMPPLVNTTGAESDISRPAKTKGLTLKKRIGYGLKKQWQMISDKTIAYCRKFTL